MKKKIIALTILALLCVTAAYAESVSRLLSDKVIRLHVVADSDSESDQSVKLRVRDAVLDTIRNGLPAPQNRADAEKILQNGMETLQNAAQAASDKPVTVTLTTEAFPTRDYDSFSLPRGEYLSLRVKIGTGAGHNWWCVIYPDVCTELCCEREDFTDRGLTEEEADLITKNGTQYEIRFRLVEFWQWIKGLFE